MTVVKALELAVWAVFVGGVTTMFARGAFRRTRAQKYRTGWIVAWTMMLTGPVFAVVYALSGLGVAETYFGNGGHRGPWYMAFVGVGMTAVAPGAIRRTTRGLRTGRHD